MGPLAFIVLSLVARSVDVVPGHAIVEVGGVDYFLIAPGETLEATVPESTTEVLELDFVRLGRKGKRSPPPSLHVLVGATHESIVVRSPVVAKRVPKRHKTWRASYPVRHRFPLEGGGVGGVLRIEITATDAPDGVLVALEVRTPSDDKLSLAPLVALPPPTSGPVVEKAQPPSPAVPVQKAAAPTTDSPTASQSASPAAAPSSSPEAASPPLPSASAADPAPSGAPPPAVTAPVVDDSATDSVPASAEDLDAERALPVWMHGQLSPGIAVQPVGGLSPLTLSFGGRFTLGVREGLLSRFGLGLGLDIGGESAATRPGSVASSIRWSTVVTRIRLEGEARLVELDLGPGRLSLGAVVGAGLMVGGHFFAVGDASTLRTIVGPTLRVGPTAGVALGPGELTATLPLDLSADLSSGVRGYWPFASTLLVGYRLAL